MDKYIGILGGLGHRATILAYEKLNDLYQIKKGSGHSCPIRLLSIDFKKINELLPYKIEEAANKMLPYVKDVDRQETICTIMLNNTLHQALDIIEQKYTFRKPLGHVGHLLREYLDNKNEKKVMLLGSMYTMNSGYFSAFFPDGIDLVKPEVSIERNLESLRISYYQKEESELAEHCYIQLMENYPEIDIFIVACTEHSMAFSRWKDSERWVDTMDLQCNWAVEKLLSTP